jgi:type III restriction enzyme
MGGASGGKGGSYNPDFVVETKEGKFYLLEVKVRDEIGDEDVKAKARAAVGWCSAMNKATGKSWEYKLLPHDSINPTQSFLGAISNAVTTI